MIVVLSQKCVGKIQECPECGAVFAYDWGDIYQDKYLYCPVCKTKILSRLDLSYDGVIKEEKKG